MSMRKCGLFGLILLALVASAVGQVTNAGEIAKRAAEARKLYFETFSDLSATETKTFRLFKKQGELKRTKAVEANFFVYRLANSADSLVEFRNVRSVNGKEISDVDKKTQEFFTKLANIKNSRSERESIRDESSRYDDELTMDGATLNQSIVLADNLFPVFEFKFVGKEVIDGKPTYVIDYSQREFTEDIAIRKKSLPDDGKTRISHYADGNDHIENSERLSGRLWIDEQTFQVRREFRQFSALFKKEARPTPIYTNKFDYVDSSFGILLPRRLEYAEYDFDKKSRKSYVDASITFEYGEFSRPDVEVESGEVNSEN